MPLRQRSDALDAMAYMLAALTPCHHVWSLWITDTHPEPHEKCLRCGKLR